MKQKQQNSNDQHQYPTYKAKANQFTPEFQLRNVHRYRVYNDTQLASTIKNLVQAMKENTNTNTTNHNDRFTKTTKFHSNLRYIVIDSIAAPFRGTPLNEIKHRNRVLSNIIQDLKILARTYGIAVCIWIYYCNTHTDTHKDTHIHTYIDT